MTMVFRASAVKPVAMLLAIPLYSHGRFGVASIEFGTDTRINQAGWITVDWTRDASQFCGSSSIGREGGSVTLTYDQPGCSCGSQKIRPRTVKHEFGHSMGLWHTGQSIDLMSGIGVAECDRNMTARKLQYLEYLYRRPVGNTDPDNDPQSAAQLAHVSARDGLRRPAGPAGQRRAAVSCAVTSWVA